MRNARWLVAGSLAAGTTATIGCHPGGPAVECGPGGRCTAAADSVLTDTSLWEVRFWQVDWPRRAGRLTRFVTAPPGVVSAERFEWWRAGDSSVAKRHAADGGPYCEGPRAAGHGVEACRVGASVPPYAGNILRTIEAQGLREHPGGALPVFADTTPDCADHVCLGPAALIVELRDGGRYRTYGYTLRLELDSAGRPALGLWHQLDFAARR
jgi:hypothetical protein